MKSKQNTPFLKWIGFFLLLIFSTQLHAQSLSEEEAALAAFMKQVPLRIVDDREVAELTLKQVLSLSLQRSLSIEASKSDEAKAGHALIASQERNGAIWSNSLESRRDISPSGSFPQLRVGRSDRLILSSTYSKRVETGMQYGLTYQETVNQSTAMTLANEGSVPKVGSTGDVLDQNSLTAFVETPLFQDWGSDLNNIPVRLSEIEVTRSQQNTLQNKLALLRQIAGTYWRLVGIVEQVKVQKKEVELSKKLVSENQLRQKMGLLTSVDVQVSKVQLAREQQSLQRLRVEVLDVEDQVRVALNLEGIKTGLFPVDPPKVQKLQFSESELFHKAMAHDANLNTLKQNLKQAGFALKQEQNKEKTNLDLSLRYTLNSVQKTPFAGVANYSHPDLQGYSAKLTWTVPLLDKVTPQKVLQKQKEVQALQLRIGNRKSELKTILRAALRSLQLSKQEVNTEFLMLQLSEEQWKQGMERFRVGKLSSFQLAKIKQERALIQQQEIQARVNYQNKVLEILLLTGDIFEYYDLPQ